jgi:hypothetical protein
VPTAIKTPIYHLLPTSEKSNTKSTPDQEAKDGLNHTEYHPISNTHTLCKKTTKFEIAIPTYEQSEGIRMDNCQMGCTRLPATTPNYHVPIADTIISPKTFSGSSNESGEEWLEYVDKYFEFRNLTEEDRIRLFNMLLRGSASDWMSTLSPQQLHSYHSLREAFKETYYPSRELRFKEASAIWQKPQEPNEKVDEFLTRIKRGARRLEISDDTLHLAVVSGLKPNLRCVVLQNGLKDLNETIRLARIAESTLSTDPVTALLLENMKNTTQIAEKQSQEIRDLTAKVSALSADTVLHQLAQKSEASAVTAATDDTQTRRMDRMYIPRSTDDRSNQSRDAQRYRNFRPRAALPQREREWRNAGARQQARPAVTQPRTECARCGLDHSRDSCPAENQICRRCSRIGHFARRCRSRLNSRNE